MKRLSLFLAAAVALVSATVSAVNPNPDPVNPPLVITTSPPVTVQGQISELSRAVSNLENQVEELASLPGSSVAEAEARVGADSSLSGSVSRLTAADGAFSNDVSNLVESDGAFSNDVSDLVESDGALSGAVQAVSSEIYTPTNNVTPAESNMFNLGSTDKPFATVNAHIFNAVGSDYQIDGVSVLTMGDDGNPTMMGNVKSINVVPMAEPYSTDNALPWSSFESTNGWAIPDGYPGWQFQGDSAFATSAPAGSTYLEQDVSLTPWPGGGYLAYTVSVDVVQSGMTQLRLGYYYPGSGRMLFVTINDSGHKEVELQYFQNPGTGAQSSNLVIQAMVAGSSSFVSISNVVLTGQGETYIWTNILMVTVTDTYASVSEVQAAAYAPTNSVVPGGTNLESGTDVSPWASVATRAVRVGGVDALVNAGGTPTLFGRAMSVASALLTNVYVTANILTNNDFVAADWAADPTRFTFTNGTVICSNMVTSFDDPAGYMITPVDYGVFEGSLNYTVDVDVAAADNHTAIRIGYECGALGAYTTETFWQYGHHTLVMAVLASANPSNLIIAAVCDAGTQYSATLSNVVFTGAGLTFSRTNTFMGAVTNEYISNIQWEKSPEGYITNITVAP